MSGEIGDLFARKPDPPKPCEGCSNPDGGLYIANCLDCQARSIASGHHFWESMKSQKLTAGYVSALRAVFGQQCDIGECHARVKAAAKKVVTGAAP